MLCFIKQRKSIRKGSSVEHKYFYKENNIRESYTELSEPIPILSSVTLVINKLHPHFDEATKLSYKLGEDGSPNHGSLLLAEYESL